MIEPALGDIARVDRAAVARALLAWFASVARDLPWRRTRDPYAIWVSEVMLQQTRVETVIPYFHRFLERFPTTSDLARAPIDDVLGAWSGLGYYRRARVLHLAAREVVARFDGRLPSTADELRSLPGVGPYTAGAVASLAFDRKEALVDGNVARVLARLLGIDEPLGTTRATKRLWEEARAHLPDERAGRFNEALMELGATVCTPRGPRCDDCPLASFCAARREGRTNELPVIAAKKATPVVKMFAFVVASRGKVLLARRAEDGLFGGLWEPPMIEASSAAKAIEALGLELGERKLLASGRVRHVLSHKTLDVRVLRAVLEAPRVDWSPRAPYERAKLVDPAEPSLGVSTLARKVLAARAPGKKIGGSRRSGTSKPEESR